MTDQPTPDPDADDPAEPLVDETDPAAEDDAEDEEEEPGTDGAAGSSGPPATRTPDDAEAAALAKAHAEIVKYSARAQRAVAARLAKEAEAADQLATWLEIRERHGLTDDSPDDVVDAAMDREVKAEMRRRFGTWSVEAALRNAAIAEGRWHDYRDIPAHIDDLGGLTLHELAAYLDNDENLPPELVADVLDHLAARRPYLTRT